MSPGYGGCPCKTPSLRGYLAPDLKAGMLCQTATGNVLDQTQGTVSPGDDTVFDPPYIYLLEDPSTACERIIAEAGNVF